MGRLSRVWRSALAEGHVLAPERYDTRRSLDADGAALGELFDLASDLVRPTKGRALVLDTTHAAEGFVLHRLDLTPATEIGSAKRRLHPGDVIVSRLRPYLRQVAYVDAALFERAPGGNDVLASSEFYVLRRRDGVDPAAVVPFLLSEPVQAALAAAQEGGHHPRVARETVLALRVPAAVLADAEQTAARVRELAAQVREAMLARDALVAEVGG